MSDSLQPHGLYSPVEYWPGVEYWIQNTEYRILEWVDFPFSRGSSQSRSPALQADSLPAEPLGKPKNTGVGSLSLLQQVFPTQESNWGLLNCRCIIYQLSYQVSLTKEQQLLLVAIKSLYYYKHGATGWPVLILTNPWRREEKSVWSRWEAL